MSDSASNIDDVEDVLSSIRRLVSETAEVKAAADIDALVLTQAQRVDSSEQESHDEKPQEEQLLTDVETPVMLDSLRQAVTGTFEDETPTFVPTAQLRAAKIEAELRPLGSSEALASNWPGQEAEEYYEDEAEQVSDPEWRVESGEDRNAGDVNSSESALDAEVVEEADLWVEPGPYEARFEDRPTEETAELHPFDPKSNVIEADWLEHGDIIDASDIEEVPEDGEEDARADADTVDADQEAQLDEEAAKVAAYLQETEQDADASDTALFTDGTEEAEIASPGPDENGEVSIDCLSDLGGQSEDDANSEGSDTVERVIEEEALRALVAEVVREELSGDMGERITRNIRKLIRREIHRALLVKEFD